MVRLTPLPNPIALLDPGTRSQAFSRRVSSHPVMNGQPTEVVDAAASMMEEAYQSAAVHVPATVSGDLPGMVRDRDFTRRVRFLLGKLRSPVMGRDIWKGTRKPLEPIDVASVFFPAGHVSTRYPAGTWMLPSLLDDPAGSRAVAVLAKEGLFEVVQLMGGWQVGFLSEWGFELVVTGETLPLAYRAAGSSTTADEWFGCMVTDPHPALQAVHAFDLGHLAEALGLALDRGCSG